MPPAPPEDTNAAAEALARAAATPGAEQYVLRLYVAGTTARSQRAIVNIRRLCEEYLHGRFTLDVIDIYQQPGIAAEEQIIAAPTLIRRLPLPLRRIIGDLSQTEKVLVGLHIRVVEPAAEAPPNPPPPA